MTETKVKIEGVFLPTRLEVLTATVRALLALCDQANESVTVEITRRRYTSKERLQRLKLRRKLIVPLAQLAGKKER